MTPARLALLTLAASLGVLAVACGSSGSKKLQGTWRGKSTEGVAPVAVASANVFATKMTLDVKGDAIVVATPKETQSGRYKVVTQDKTRVVITTDKDGPDDPQAFTFVDDRTLRWAVLEGKAIVFARQ